MSNNFLSAVVITVFLALIAGAIIAWINYRQRVLEIKRKSIQESLLPTSLSEIKKLNLENTSVGQELLKELSKPLLRESELEKPIVDDKDYTEISIWGTTGSGKSSLLHSFSASLFRYYQLDNQAFYLRDENGIPANPFWRYEFPMPTQSLTEQTYIFSRRFPPNVKGAEVSSHEHHLVFQDNSGEQLVSVVLDSNTRDLTARKLFSSDGILVTLDPSQVENNSSRRNEYTQLISNLFEFVQENQTSKKYWAFCLTKMDLYPQLIRSDPLYVLEQLFGSEMLRLINSRMAQNEIRVFITSAVGFYSEHKSNYNYESGNLASAEQWEPYNVESPFFWIFENIERQRLSRVKPSLFRKDRLKEYIPYPSRRS